MSNISVTFICNGQSFRCNPYSIFPLRRPDGAGPLHANVAPSSGGGAHLGQAEVRAIARTVLADAASQSANAGQQPHQCAGHALSITCETTY